MPSSPIRLNFINIHTHAHGSRPPKGTIENALDSFQNLQSDRNYSIGLHPWYLKAETAETLFKELEKACEQANVLAIGECGLDKHCETDFNLQEVYFTKQIKLANRINKPLIIHCVKAYEEVLKCLKVADSKVPVIFHGFNKNEKLAAQLIHAGHYLSFGKKLIHENSMAVLQTIPADRFFLETDDASVGIEEIYAAAALARKSDINSIHQQLTKNTIAVFGKSIS